MDNIDIDSLIMLYGKTVYGFCLRLARSKDNVSGGKRNSTMEL
ncbi:hypothetical protein [Acetivibrio straminisolvens]|nr:hypothetical protein [Acetivibrio straminisolvens]